MVPISCGEYLLPDLEPGTLGPTRPWAATGSLGLTKEGRQSTGKTKGDAIMIATRTHREAPPVDQELEVPVPRVEPGDVDLEKRIVLPWYRRVPAPGLTGSRHYPRPGRR